MTLTQTAEVTASMTFGKIVLSNQSMTLACMRVSAPFERKSAVQSGKASPGGQKNFYPSTTRPHTIGGSFSASPVIHPEGTVVQFQARYTRDGSPIRDGSIFLRLRNDAAFIVIKASLPIGPEAVLGDSLVIFQGNADILSVEELDLLGIKISRSYASNFMDPEEIEEIYSYNTLAAERTPRPSFIKTVSGGKVVVKTVTPDPVRRVGRIRRGAMSS